MRLLVMCLIGMLACAVFSAGYVPKPDEKVVKMTIKSKGDIFFLLYPKDAPKTVEHFLSLVKDNFYSGIKFHRVVDNFVIQAGDPQTKNKDINAPGIGSGGSGASVPLEGKNLSHLRGTLGLARSSDPNSGDSQFFVNLKDNTFLNKEYCVFGKVVSGLELIDKVVQGDVIESIVIVTPPSAAAAAKKPEIKPAVKTPAKKTDKKKTTSKKTTSNKK